MYQPKRAFVAGQFPSPGRMARRVGAGVGAARAAKGQGGEGDDGGLYADGCGG